MHQHQTQQGQLPTQMVVATHAHPSQQHFTKEEKKICCNCTRATVCFFTVLLCIGGSALIAVGLSHLVKHANRYAMIGDYNDYVDSLATTYPTKSTTVAAGVDNITLHQPILAAPVSASPTFHAVEPMTSVVELTSYTSYLFVATVKNWIPEEYARFTVNNDKSKVRYGKNTLYDIVPVSESVDRFIPTTKKIAVEASCNIHACVKDCEHHKECNKGSMQQYCALEYGDDAIYTGASECEGDDVCGTCTYIGQLEKVCVVLEEDMALGFAHHLDSCYYPFKYDSQIYGPKKTGNFSQQVKVEFRSAADPYITMQRITEGTMEFGHPTKYASSGVLLIFLGLGLILVPCCALCCYRCCCYSSQKKLNSTSARSMEDSDAANQTSDVPMGEIRYDNEPYAVAIPVTNVRGGASGSRSEEPQRGPYVVTEYQDENRIFYPRSSISSSSQGQHLAEEEVELEIEEPKKRGV